MIINKDWKIESDAYQVILLQRKVSEKSKKFPEGNETWKPTYHRNVPQAFERLINNGVNATGLEDLESVRDCIQDLYRLFSTIPVVTLEKIVYREKKDEKSEEVEEIES